METKFSIVVPAYNVANFLEACLASILAQSYPHFELILIDDGSTDNTPAICDRFAEKDARVRVVHKPNGGVSAARNTGIELASGDFFLFFDADDFVEPDTCEQIAHLLEEHRADTLIYGYHRTQNGHVVETCPPLFPQALYQDNDILHTLLPRFVGISYAGINTWLCGGQNGLTVENPALWRAAVSVDIIRQNALRFDPTLKVGEDTVFITEYLSCARRCYVHHACLYYLVLHPASTIARYEKDPAAKLDGKEKLLAARTALTARILQRTGVDISPHWLGTVVMSCVELAFLFSQKGLPGSFSHRFSLFRQYAALPPVQQAVRAFPLAKKAGLLPIPFLLLKARLYRLLFLGTALLNRTPYKFQRG